MDHGCSFRLIGSARAGLENLGERGDDADDDRIRLVVLVIEYSPDSFDSRGDALELGRDNCSITSSLTAFFSAQTRPFAKKQMEVRYKSQRVF